MAGEYPNNAKVQSIHDDLLNTMLMWRSKNEVALPAVLCRELAGDLLPKVVDYITQNGGNVTVLVES